MARLDNDMIVFGNEKTKKKSRIKPHSVFVEEMRDIAPTVEIVGLYTGYNNSVKCRCRICNNEWDGYPASLRDGASCPKCTKERMAKLFTKSHDQFISQMALRNKNVRIVGEYRGDGIKIECQCVENEKHSWWATPSNLLQGSGCPHCARTQTSFMEQVILLALERTLGDGNVLHRDATMIGKELDIYIKSLNTAIEPGSYAFHRHRIKQDTERYNLCREKGIRLITIYDMFNGNRSLLEFDSDDLWTYPINLGDRNRNQELLGCVKRIFDTLDLTYNFSEDEERQLLIDAKRSVSRKKTGDVVKELAEINETIELLDQYEDYDTKMKCRCKKCGKEFESNYDHLIRRKQGCPHCYRAKTIVVNLDTGEIFASAKEAGLSLGLSSNAVVIACRNGTRCNGNSWAYLKDLTPEQLTDLRTQFPDTFKY